VSSKSKKFILIQRVLIWTLYFFSGFILYSEKGILPSKLITFSRIIYPLSVFWLQIRIKKRTNFLPIDSKMTTSQLWFNLLPVIASLLTVIFSLTNSFLYILGKLIKHDFKGKVVFVIGENGLDLAKTYNVDLPIIKIGNWIGPLLVDAAIKKVKTVILFGYHGKLIKLAGGIFHTHNHLADARIEILVYLAVQEKLPLEIIVKLSELNTLEDGLLLLERFNKSLADKLFKNLSNTIEKRSFAYVNRYVKTDMEIASIIFDRKREIRWAGNYGNNYFSYFK